MGIENRDSSQIAKNAMIEKLTTKLNHSIACHGENWHHDITKADFVDLSVSTRLVLEDKIWCLIRWRQKIPDIPIANVSTKEASDTDKNGLSQSPSPNTKKKKYNDEYFWSSQATYLAKLNVKENEIYLPDFFEKKLESKWKAIQRRTDRTIQELKSSKVSEEEKKKTTQEQFKQYKVKCKVILQKQK